MKAGALVHPGPFMLPGLQRTSQNTYSPTFREQTALTPPDCPCEQSQDATAKRSTTVTRRGFPKHKSFACTSYPRGHCGGPEKVGNTSPLTNISASSEHTTDVLSEPRGRLLRAFVRGSGPRGVVNRSESLRIALRGCFFTLL
jgi:hypothetical protein